MMAFRTALIQRLNLTKPNIFPERILRNAKVLIAQAPK